MDQENAIQPGRLRFDTRSKVEDRCATSNASSEQAGRAGGNSSQQFRGVNCNGWRRSLEFLPLKRVLPAKLRCS